MHRTLSAAGHRPLVRSRARQIAVIALLAGTAIAATPSSALAWWPRPWWGPRIAIRVAVPTPVFVAPPPPVHVVPRERAWVGPHYDWRGRWIPGHWRRA